MSKKLTVVFTEEEKLQAFAEELAKMESALLIAKLSKASINQIAAQARLEENPVVIVNFSSDFDMCSNEKYLIGELLNKIEDVVMVVVAPLSRTFELTNVENDLDIGYIFAAHFTEDEALQLYYDKTTKKYLIDENGNRIANKRPYQVAM